MLWDERGQVTLAGEKIADSNISDLVSDAMRKRKGLDPTGSKRFFRVLLLNVCLRMLQEIHNIGSKVKQAEHPLVMRILPLVQDSFKVF